MEEGDLITNTYNDYDPNEEKVLEEMRCIRCVLERILRVMDEGLFVDYQMEKFGKNYKPKEPIPETVNALHYVPKESDPPVE